jgi:hypothetical protein
MGFKEMVAADNLRTFLDVSTFGELRTVIYDGETYDGEDEEGIPCLITHLKEQDRTTTMRDHEQNIYRVDVIFHAKLDDIGGSLPEKGRKFAIYDPDDKFLRQYYIAESSVAMGMVKLELEAFDE